MKHVTNLLSDYVDEELNHETVRQVDEHLAGCEPCKQRLRALRRMVRFMRGNSQRDIVEGTAADGLARFNLQLMGTEASDIDLAGFVLEEAQRLLGVKEVQR